MNNLPLRGVTVLEFSQYLSGPSAGLRLADLGARVIKIERPDSGDACRQLAIKNLWADDSSLLFHTINRGKESFAANLKNHEHVVLIKRLIEDVDVITHNFRPGVMEKVGLDYAAVKQINPQIIYAEISGYGKRGPWKNKPGQDLLLQSISGLVYTSGNNNDGPVPFGLAVADILCGAQLVQGILGALIRRHKSGKGAFVELSLMESVLDFQFELLTTYYTNNQVPKRSATNNGHPLLGAPYGIYATADGYIAIAMVNINQLADIIDCSPLKNFTQQETFSNRDKVKKVLASHLLTKTSSHWMQKMQTVDMWAMEVLDWNEMKEHEGYKCLEMEQCLISSDGKEIITTRCPIRFNGKKIFSNKPAPKLGEHNGKILNELNVYSV
jgi:crotonobetainyl-CoA:carnitine CoA-transferase CaiB-like acyl-CoA transferase